MNLSWTTHGIWRGDPTEAVAVAVEIPVVVAEADYRLTADPNFLPRLAIVAVGKHGHCEQRNNAANLLPLPVGEGWGEG